jgi:hypothetical protein
MVGDTGGFAFGVVGQDTPLLLTGPRYSEPFFDQRHRKRGQELHAGTEHSDSWFLGAATCCSALE